MAARACVNFRVKNIHKNLLARSSLRGIASLSSPLQSDKASSSKSPPPADEKVTHTGQVFEKDDYRLVRFVDKQKLVNTRFAIDLINEEPPKPEKKRVTWCEGGGGPLGHPRVYINLDKPGNHICGYCGLRFYKDQHHH